MQITDSMEMPGKGEKLFFHLPWSNPLGYQEWKDPIHLGKLLWGPKENSYSG